MEIPLLTRRLSKEHRQNPGADFLIARGVWIDIVLGAILAVVLFSTSFRRGWTHVETDFPNYYTAAAATRAATRHGSPLKSLYDWTWFQREMNYTGTERQLGAYTPQSPLAMLPFLPIAGLPPQQAKHVWLSVNALLLAATIVLLASVSGLAYRWIFAILLAGYGSLHSNFVLGQYYVLLAFLLTLSAWCFFRAREKSAGALLGILLALKLYSAPFALFFLIKRRWKATAAMAATAAAFALISIAMFGWSANLFFLQSVLPNVMSGMLIDPYNVGQGSMTALLRRTFVPEPELNPSPLMNWPAAFVFLQTAFSLGVLTVAVLCLWRRAALTPREFAWLVIALLLLAPVNATYVFTMLVLPVALLMSESKLLGRIALLAGLAVLGAPLPRDVLAVFPRVWILSAMFLWAAWPAIRSVNARLLVAACAAVSLAAVIAARNAPPPEPFERLSQSGYSIAVMNPALSAAGVIYQSFGDGRYVLRTASRSYTFEGHAFQPAASFRGGPVLFELVSQGRSRIMRLDLESGKSEQAVPFAANPRNPAISLDGARIAYVAEGTLWLDAKNLAIAGSDPAFSPDGSRILFAHEGRILSFDIDTGRVDNVVMEGRDTEGSVTEGSDLAHPSLSPDGTMLAYSGTSRGRRQIWWRRLQGGAATQLTSAGCNHESPVWEASSQSLIFTSDCGRGLGLPGLYRAKVAKTPAPR
jgi:hypothetical protein